MDEILLYFTFIFYHIASKPLFGWLRMGTFLQISEGVNGVVESLLLARVVEMKMKLFFMCFAIASTLFRYGFTSFRLIL